MSPTLEEYVRDQFDGMIVIGDVHGNYDAISRAYEYAKSNNYFFMSLGDLVDRDRQPYETVEVMYRAVYDGRGGFTIGNHDDKFIRYSKGASVRFSSDSKQTLEDVGTEREAEFLRMYNFIVSEPMLSAYYHKFDDIVIVHGASHSSIWEGNPKMDSSAKSRFTYGQTTGETYPDGYPVRTYEWIDDIPMGRTVIVGHDKQPIHNIAITEPMTVSNANGGKAVFVDTGCGKGGFLSAAIIMQEKKKFKLVDFKDFK